MAKKKVTKKKTKKKVARKKVKETIIPESMPAAESLEQVPETAPVPQTGTIADNEIQ